MVARRGVGPIFLTLNTEQRTREPKRKSGLQKLEKAKLFLGPQKRYSSANSLTLAQCDLYEIPELQNCNIIYLYALSHIDDNLLQQQQGTIRSIGSD